MKNVILTGATGMTGSLVLDHCLQSSDVSKVTTLVRRPTGIEHEKLIEVLHTNFLDFSAIKGHFDSQDVAYYCLGVYTGAVDKEEFRKITVDYTEAFADTLHSHSPGATVCFLSGQGADQTGKSRIMFARDKGIAENYLLNLKFKATHIFRPAYIYPSTPRKEPNFSYRLMRFLYPVVKVLYPNGVITSEDLARAIFHTGLHGTKMTILENSDIKAIGEHQQFTT